MEKDREIYIVSLEDETYAMALTEEQVKVFEWLKDFGYDFSITKQSVIITL